MESDLKFLNGIEVMDLQRISFPSLIKSLNHIPLV